MWFRNLFDSLTSQRSAGRTRPAQIAAARRRLGGRPLVVESLENRNLLAALFTISDFEIIEGDNGTQQAQVVVSLTEPHGNRVTVSYRTVDVGSATSPSDFTAVSGTLTFAKNETSKTISIPVHGDTDLESDETFSVRLSNAKGAKIADATGFVTILNDEPRISINDVWGDEGNTGNTSFEFLVALSGAHNEQVTVDFETADGTATADEDFVYQAGTLTFDVGETEKVITVEVIGDRIHEYGETFAVDLSNSNAAFTKSSGAGTIYDDEPRIYISDAVNYYEESTFTFYVSLSAAYDEEVTVDFQTVDGTAVAGVNYVYTAGTLTFIPGEETTLTITVDVLDPELFDKYFYVQLSNASENALIEYEYAYGYWYIDYGYYYYDYGYYDYGYYYGW